MNKSLFFKLAFIATCLAMVVVLLGAYTRLADAGLGCPDWPGCYGHIGVPKHVDDVAAAISCSTQLWYLSYQFFS